ncbi:MAG: hypothetical protein RIS76_2885, partial [Verrucomicrobiota bacterium]
MMIRPWGVHPKAKQTERPRMCFRRVVNPLLYFAKTGCPWA